MGCPVRPLPALRTPLALLLAAALLPAVVAPTAAVAATPTACPGDDVPATAFADTRTSLHRLAIDCAAWWGLVSGTSETTFVPAGDVTRGQTAAMVARMLRSTGDVPTEVPSAGFADTDGNVFEADIDLLASLGIVSGTSPTTFEPGESVTREQMASIIGETFAEGYGDPLPAGPESFTDVSLGNVHRDAIGRLVTAGITSGTTATTFDPSADVSRAQMAAFLTRATSLLVEDGVASLPAARPAADDAYASRTRAAWVHLFDDTLKTPAGVQRLVDELAAADANTIIAQVARRHDAYYDSDVLPRTADPRIAADFDVLEALLTAAHAQGIEVHAWYGVAPTWHDVYADLPAPDGWIATEHGQNAPDADKWVTRISDSDAKWSEYLDPGVPEVRAHVAAVVGELADRYLVDGIHLDYVRYPSAQHGYNPKALAAYRADTGLTGTPDPGDAAWSAWRREQTQAIVRAAKQATLASGRDITLSAAVISWQDGPPTPDRAGFRRSTPYNRVLQDWDRWVREGTLDAVMPMNYFRDHVGEQERWFDEWIAYERALAGVSDVAVIPGPGGYLNRPGNALAQVREGMRVDGASVYSYQQPTVDGSRTIWDRLAQTRWGYHPQR